MFNGVCVSFIIQKLSGSVLDWVSSGSRFKYRPGYWLCLQRWLCSSLSGEWPRPRLSKSFLIHNWSYLHLVQYLEFICYWITERSTGPWCDTHNLAVRSGNILQVGMYLLLIRTVLGFNLCPETGCPKSFVLFFSYLHCWEGAFKHTISACIQAFLK